MNFQIAVTFLMLKGVRPNKKNIMNVSKKSTPRQSLGVLFLIEMMDFFLVDLFYDLATKTSTIQPVLRQHTFGFVR